MDAPVFPLISGMSMALSVVFTLVGLCLVTIGTPKEAKITIALLVIALILGVISVITRSFK